MSLLHDVLPRALEIGHASHPFRPLHQRQRLPQISLHPLRPPLPLARRPDPVEHPLQLEGQIHPPALSFDLVCPARGGRHADQATQRIPRQADIGRVMHVRFDDDRIVASAQRIARLTPGQFVTRFHHKAIDRGQQFRREERDVSCQRPTAFEGSFKPVAHPQRPAQIQVIGSQVVQLVEVPGYPLFQSPSRKTFHSPMPGRTSSELVPFVFSPSTSTEEFVFTRIAFFSRSNILSRRSRLQWNYWIPFDTAGISSRQRVSNLTSSMAICPSVI